MLPTLHELMRPRLSSSIARVPSGLPGVGSVPWGSHLCVFYQTAADFRDALVPYFSAGLTHNEACMWVTSTLVPVTSARESLSRAVPELERYEESGQLRILDAEAWYAQICSAGTSNTGGSVLEAWLEQERAALQQGYAGLRVSGDTFWLETRKDWCDFAAYEAAVDQAFVERRIIALCSYSLERCSMDDALDVLRSHRPGLIRRDGSWVLVNSASELLQAAGSALSDDRDAAARLLSLQRVTEAFSEAITVPELQHVLERDVCRAAGAQRTVMVEVDDTKGTLEIVGCVGITQDLARRYVRSKISAQLPSAESFRSGLPVWLHEAESVARRYPALPTDARAIAAIPLKAGGRRLGAIVFGFDQAQPFDRAQRALLEDIAHQAGFALERVRLYEEAQVQRARAERANQAKDDFLAVLGHELRNPLATITNATELLRLKGGPRVDALGGNGAEDVVERACAVIERQSTHMTRLIEELLDVSRIVRGKVDIERRQVNLMDILREAAEDRAVELQRRELTLNVDFDGSALWTRGDQTRLSQIFGNLLANAIKFTPPGGTITLIARADGDHAIISIADSGQGIEAAEIGHIFEPFRQSKQATSRPAGGLGLGLAVVKGLVELHGGSVRAVSEGSGKGSVFSVRIPLQSPCVEAHESASPGSATGSRVLVVEDNRDMADMLMELLRMSGYEAAVAYSGADALELARRFKPEAVLCDLGLPGDIDGYELARALRGDVQLKPALLVALTGHGGPSDLQQTREAGFDSHLTKPVDFPVIRNLLGKLAPAV